MADHVRLITELKLWQKKNPRKLIRLGESVTEDGRLVLKLMIHETKFHLLCPSNYPEHEDAFFMETECRDFWCVALNEFIIDSPQKLMLDVILAKIFLYYTPATACEKSSEELLSSENESDCDFEDNSEVSETDINDEWESLISRKKKEWREKEGQLRIRYNRPKISDMFDGKIMDHPQQVFSNSAASAILINDLINIMGSKESNGIVVDPVENDICRWSVSLKGFHPEFRISEDLEKIEELYGYNDVQLRLDFMMDLYPSHPPSMTIIRPKLLNVFQSNDFVEFGNWNPARDMMSVIKEIKKYIELNGRVDFQSKCNGINVSAFQKLSAELAYVIEHERKPESEKIETFSSSSTATAQNLEQNNYSEKCLTRTRDSSPLSSVKADTSLEIILMELLRFLKECEREYVVEGSGHFTFDLSSKNNFFEKKNHESRFSKDSNNLSSSSGDVKRLLKTKKLKEIQSHSLIQKRVAPQWYNKHCRIITNPFFGMPSSESRTHSGSKNEKYFVTYGPEDKKNEFDGSKQKNETDVKHTVISSFNINVTSTKESSRMPPSKGSLESIAYISDVYKVLPKSILLSYIRCKLNVDTFYGIWQATSLYSKIIQIISELASNPHLNDLLFISDAQDQSIAALIKIQGKNVTLILEKFADFPDGHPVTKADLDKLELAKSIIKVSELIESQLQAHTSGKLPPKLFSKFDNEFDDKFESVDYIYEESLGDLKFSNCDIDLETHSFKHNYNADIHTPKNYFQIAQEFALLSKYLPSVKQSPAIFIRTDNSKPSLMQALITGTEGTPCSGGCFTFDIYLNANYPNDGIEIQLTTFVNGGKTTLHFDQCTTQLSVERDTIFYPKSRLLQVLTSIRTEQFIPLEILDDIQCDGYPEYPNWPENLSDMIFSKDWARIQ